MDTATASTQNQTETSGEAKADNKFDDLHKSDLNYNLPTDSTAEQTETVGKEKVDDLNKSELNCNSPTGSTAEQTETAGKAKADNKVDDLNKSELNYNSPTGSTAEQTETAGKAKAGNKVDDLNKSDLDYNSLARSSIEVQTEIAGEANADYKFQDLNKSDLDYNSPTRRNIEVQTEITGEANADYKFEDLNKSDLDYKSPTRSNIEVQTEIAGEADADNKFEDLNKPDLYYNSPTRRNIAVQTETIDLSKNLKYDASMTNTLQRTEAAVGNRCNAPFRSEGNSELTESEKENQSPVANSSKRTEKKYSALNYFTILSKGRKVNRSDLKPEVLEGLDKAVREMMKLEFQKFSARAAKRLKPLNSNSSESNTPSALPEPFTTLKKTKTRYFVYKKKEEKNYIELSHLKLLYQTTLIICPKEELNPRFVAVLLGKLDGGVETNHHWVSDSSVVPPRRVWGGAVAKFRNNRLVHNAIDEIQEKYSESLTVIGFNEWIDVIVKAECLYPKREKKDTKVFLRANGGTEDSSISLLQSKLTDFGFYREIYLDLFEPCGIFGHVKYPTQAQAYLVQIALTGCRVSKLGFLQAEVEVDEEGKEFHSYVRQRFKEILQSNKQLPET